MPAKGEIFVCMNANIRSTLIKYSRRARGHAPSAIAVILTIIGASATAAIVPLFYKRFFDILAAAAERATVVDRLIQVLMIIAALQILQWAFWRMAGFVNAYFQSTVMTELADDCFQYLHKHSFAFFNNNFVGSLVKRVNYFTRAFEGTADRITWDMLPLLTQLVVIMTVLFSKNTWLGLVVLLWTALFMIVNWKFAVYKIKFDLERSAAETKATGQLADTITNHSNVKLFVGYGREVGTFRALLNRVNKLRIFTWNLNNIFEGLQAILTIALEIGVLYIAIHLWARGAFTIGDFVLLQTYVIVIFDKIWNFGKLIRSMYTDLADAAEMTALLDTPHEITDRAQAKPLVVQKGKIEFKNVGFYYHATRKIFSNFSLTINPKEKVALVGPSGAGKSTVVKLLLRLHDVTSGQILIDNQAISHVTQESLWSAVSLVPQEPLMFHRSLFENIRYGKPEATDEQVYEAARLAHCDEFIAEFPDKYQTFVGERGVKLSGGERQRVAIARAILRNTPILVLDEATSSLDSESEALIQDALHKLMENKTVVVIAHRLSTIMRMDRIVVVDHGQVVEMGTHQQLLAKPQGLYQDLWKLQAGGFMPDKPANNSTEALLKEWSYKPPNIATDST